MPERGGIMFQTPGMEPFLISDCDVCVVVVVCEFGKAGELALDDFLMGWLPK